jgi:hypothetical protein
VKGFAKVYREDMLAAVVGHGVRMDLAKEIFRKGIDLYHEKYYLGSKNPLFKWWHRKKTPKQFARSQMCAFGTWDHLLYKVLDDKDNTEVAWLCYSHESDTDPVNALYKTCTEYAWVDSEMSAFINKYKHWLESCK